MKRWILGVLFFALNAWGQVQLKSIEYSGTGCPQASVRAVLAPDGSAFSILYDRFNTEVGPSMLLARQQCSVILHLKKPRHVGFRIEAADFRGFVALDEGVRATQNVKVMSGPNPGHRMLSAEFGQQTWVGPINEDFSLRALRPINHRPPVLDCVPAKENTDIVIESLVQVSSSNGDQSGQLTVDTADGSLLQNFTLTWLDCSPGRGRGRR